MENLEAKSTDAITVEDILSTTRVQQILNSNVVEVQNLCKRASLKPRKDELGNIYFSKSDVDILKKVKELYEHTRLIQEMKKKNEVQNTLHHGENTPENLLARAKAKLRNELMTSESAQVAQVPLKTPRVLQQPEQPQQVSRPEVPFSKFKNCLTSLEDSIITKMNSILNEKMDGLDEVVLELIRSKTENEALRQRLNELNKENFSLKNENHSYKSVGLGLFVKKQNDIY